MHDIILLTMVMVVYCGKNPQKAFCLVQCECLSSHDRIQDINNDTIPSLLSPVDCCVNRVVWCFTTQGMASVGQEELVIILETAPDDAAPPRDIFIHLNNVYEDASKGIVDIQKTPAKCVSKTLCWL